MKVIRILVPVIVLAGAAVLAFGDDAADRIRQAVLDAAARYQGVPYRYGAESPEAFDCSGFVRWVYREASGLELPRSARDYMAVGQEVQAALAMPGDIFVFNTVGTRASHVALFTGSSLIHAVSDGPRTGVIISPMDDPYWSARIMSVRQVLPASASGSGLATATPGAPTPTPAPVQAPAPAPAPAAISSASQSVAADKAVVDIGVKIPAEKEAFVDPVATQSGTGIAFTITNASGIANDFTVMFVVLDKKTLAVHELYRQKITLGLGQSISLPAYAFDKPGKYRLIVKGDWGAHLVERTFVVSER